MSTKLKGKISGWLAGLHSHGIYPEPELAKEFEEATGHKACWMTHSKGNTNSSQGQFKGVEKPIPGADHERCSYGYEIAAALEEKFAKSHTWANYSGRGFSFQAAYRALEKAGF